jgi:hypothetical protein
MLTGLCTKEPRRHQDGGGRGRNSKWTPSVYNSEAKAHVGFLVNKVALAQVFLRILQLCHVSNIPTMLNTAFHASAIGGVQS